MVSIAFKMQDASVNHERTFEGTTTQEVLNSFDAYLHEIIPEMFNAEGPQVQPAAEGHAEKWWQFRQTKQDEGEK